MAEKPSPYARFKHLQVYNTRLARDQKWHMIRRLCQDSSWPFTGDLRPEDIVCMRDTFCGARRTPSCMPSGSAYDSLYHQTAGWNQWATNDTREHFKECLYSATQEDLYRTVPVCANSTYGHDLDRFMDFTYRDHAHINTCREFFQHGPISTLPSIKDLNPKYPPDS